LLEPAPEKDIAMSDFKPWWEKVADYRDDDQEEFLRGVFQGRTPYRPKQPSPYLLGLAAGYRNREFARPESFKSNK
jgi:hypothetical protein